MLLIQTWLFTWLVLGIAVYWVWRGWGTWLIGILLSGCIIDFQWIFSLVFTDILTFLWQTVLILRLLSMCWVLGFVQWNYFLNLFQRISSTSWRFDIYLGPLGALNHFLSTLVCLWHNSNFVLVQRDRCLIRLYSLCGRFGTDRVGYGLFFRLAFLKSLFIILLCLLLSLTQASSLDFRLILEHNGAPSRC